MCGGGPEGGGHGHSLRLAPAARACQGQGRPRQGRGAGKAELQPSYLSPGAVKLEAESFIVSGEIAECGTCSCAVLTRTQFQVTNLLVA